MVLKYKMKGAYLTPDPLNYFDSISTMQPSGWHRDWSNIVSTRSAVAYMIHGINPEDYIRLCTNPYDFMCRIKVGRSDQLKHGGIPVQRNTRYYISTDGAELIKIAPPTGTAGTYKKATGVSDAEYARVMTETGGQWDERVCTKNKSVHVERLTNIQAGHVVTICNNVKDFRFDNINYEYYINEAKKLII